jgi:hypothetical protein
MPIPIPDRAATPQQLVFDFMARDSTDKPTEG